MSGVASRDDMETVATLLSGAAIRIRPLQPVDENLLVEFAAQITAEDLRLRFFAAVTELTHEMAANLARVDFSRDMALIARPANKDEILGVARYMSDPLSHEAEFAVLVRSDHKGQGVGWMLMKRLVDVARRHGITKLSGLVLKENRNMLQFCRELGFAIATSPDDPMTVTASLSLV